MSRHGKVGMIAAAILVGTFVILGFKFLPSDNAGAAEGSVQVPVLAISHYTVKSGDSLSSIAQRFLGSASKWDALVHANPWIKDPNIIEPGWVLIVPASGTALAATTQAPDNGHCDSDQDGDDNGCAAAIHPVASVIYGATTGTFSYASLEALWVSAGGSAGTEATAACIAEHESGGNPKAISPTNDWGLWQIHAGGYPMLDPAANAQRAVAMSSDGTNWTAWTTHSACGVLG
jgi:murein DD-endopeptidase MepM/ murein hydrolase activator NlpD